MKNKQKGSIVTVLSVIIAVLVIVVGFLFYQNNQLTIEKQVQEVVTQTPRVTEVTISPSPTNSSSQVSTWKTYTNEKHGLEFKLPASFAVVSEEEIRGVYTGYYRSNSVSATGYFNIVIDPLAVIQERARILASNNSQQPVTLENTITMVRSYDTFFSKAKRIATGMVSGIPSITEEVESVDDNGSSIAIVTYMLRNNHLVSISTPPSITNSLRTQILSNLKFR